MDLKACIYVYYLWINFCRAKVCSWWMLSTSMSIQNRCNWKFVLFLKLSPEKYPSLSLICKTVRLRQMSLRCTQIRLITKCHPRQWTLTSHLRANREVTSPIFIATRAFVCFLNDANARLSGVNNVVWVYFFTCRGADRLARTLIRNVVS